MTDLWEGTELEPVEMHMMSDEVGDLIMPRAVWEQVGTPGHMGQFEWADRLWLVGGIARYGPDKIKLRVRRIG